MLGLYFTQVPSPVLHDKSSTPRLLFVCNIENHQLLQVRTLFVLPWLSLLMFRRKFNSSFQFLRNHHQCEVFG